ncbi:hypothetical protein D9M68_726400 [compost metagenome]
MTSQNFSSKCWSLDSLKVRVRCGLMALAAQIRCTLAGEIPATRAMLRQLQRGCPTGGWVTCSTARLKASAGKDGLRPRPGASINPANRRAWKR